MNGLKLTSLRSLLLFFSCMLLHTLLKTASRCPLVSCAQLTTAGNSDTHDRLDYISGIGNAVVAIYSSVQSCISAYSKPTGQCLSGHHTSLLHCSMPVQCFCPLVNAHLVIASITVDNTVGTSAGSVSQSEALSAPVPQVHA